MTRMSNTPPKVGLARNTANYGDRDFALYLRRSFAKSMGYSQTMLDKPVVGIVDTGSDYNNCHRTVPELIELLKKNPGKYSYASAGNGTTLHLSGELFKTMAGGLRITHIPYKGGAPSVVAAMSGEVQYLFNPMSTSLSVFKSGKLRLIAVTGLQRDALAPAIPTVAESGYPGFEALFWIGIVAPTGTPAAIVNKLNAEMIRILGEADVKEKLVSQGLDLFAETPEYFAKFIRDDHARYGRMAKEIGLVAK